MWKHYRNAARRDRVVWQSLVGHDLNDLAAYHMQQSAEKYLKSIIMKYDLFPITGHMPFISLLEDISNHSTNPKLSLFRYFLDNMTDEKRTLFWKLSLEIKIADNERKILEETMYKCEKSLTDTKYCIYDIVRYYENRSFRSEYTKDVKCNAWVFIAHSLMTLMLVLPHVDLGRYPTMIDGSLSADLYRMRSRIAYLEEKVDFFCEDAEEVLSWGLGENS